MNVNFQQIYEDEIEEVKNAHNQYAESTNSPSGSTTNAVNHAVKNLFTSVVFPTYMKDKKPFIDAVADIGDMDNEECMEKYDDAYANVHKHSSVKSLSEVFKRREPLTLEQSGDIANQYTKILLSLFAGVRFVNI